LDLVNLKWGFECIPIKRSPNTIEQIPLTNADGEYIMYPHAEIGSKFSEGEIVISYEQDDKNCNCHPLGQRSEEVGKENIIMALIDISTPMNIDEILKDLKSQLLKWKKALNFPNPRGAKAPVEKENTIVKNAKIWKSYLIVYDLIDKRMSPEEVSDTLAEYDELYSEVKNIKYHYKSAENLINFGYKKYI
jgi:hypothetical protein